jgi:hypothetical protein
MKNLRQLCVAFVFTCALAMPAFAGQIDTMAVPPPPPAPAAATAGEIDTGVAGQIEIGSSEATATDSVTEVALNLLQSVLSLF